MFESNITTFEGRQTTFLRFELSNKVQSNNAPAPVLSMLLLKNDYQCHPCVPMFNIVKHCLRMFKFV
jgi:hypothetical protein